MNQSQNKDLVLNLICKTYEQIGVPPSIRDLCDLLNLSPHAVHRWQEILLKEGKLRKVNNWSARNYVPTGYKVVKTERTQ